MNSERLKELAALHALNALAGDEAAEFQQLLADKTTRSAEEAAAFAEVTALLAAGRCDAKSPPPHLKQLILDRARAQQAREGLAAKLHQLVPPSMDGFTFLNEAGSAGDWIELPVPGACVKLLSFDPSRDHALVMGRLDPGARYPMHKHVEAEEIYMLSGDLHIGNRALKTGDFHRAEAGTTHGVNHSEEGCVILVNISAKDLLSQFVPT